MKTTIARSLSRGVIVVVSLLPLAALAQSRSAGLGATQLDGLKPFTDCLEKVKGHHEHLIADRLAAKLAVSPALTAEERAVWQRDIDALRAVTPQKPTLTAPDPKDPQHYLLGLSDQEQHVDQFDEQPLQPRDEPRVRAEVRRHDAVFAGVGSIGEPAL